MSLKNWKVVLKLFDKDDPPSPKAGIQAMVDTIKEALVHVDGLHPGDPQAIEIAKLVRTYTEKNKQILGIGYDDFEDLPTTDESSAPEVISACFQDVYDTYSLHNPPRSLCIDEGASALVIDGETISFRPGKPFAILKALVNSRNHRLSHLDLAAEVWGDDSVDRAVIHQTIHNLRNELLRKNIKQITIKSAAEYVTLDRI